MKIAGREIGPEHPPYIIAELSANHGGSLQTALDLIKAAANTGANAVKIQVYGPESMTIDCGEQDFIIKDGPWKGRRLWDLYAQGQTPIKWLPNMFAYARECGITIFASVFDIAGISECERLNSPAYKVASFEINHLGLLRAIAETGKPVIVSTGMANAADITFALNEFNNNEVALLHCVSAYPTPEACANLGRIGQLYGSFEKPVGFSDHTLGYGSAVAAVALGACIIEKHLMSDNMVDTLDEEFSAPAEEFYRMAKRCRAIWHSLHPSYSPFVDMRDIEASSKRLRRSIFVVQDIKAGEPFTNINIACIRPASGLEPHNFDGLMKLTAKINLKRGTPLRSEHVK